MVVRHFSGLGARVLHRRVGGRAGSRRRTPPPAARRSAGGCTAEGLVRGGSAEAPLRVGIIGGAGLLVPASLYPWMPPAALAVVGLTIVNFFAALPWGPASAAAAAIVPPPIRTQGAALYF